MEKTLKLNSLSVVITITLNLEDGKFNVKWEGPSIPIPATYFKTLFDEVYKSVQQKADNNGMLFADKKEDKQLNVLGEKRSNEDLN
jgi:hypothetical protein